MSMVAHCPGDHAVFAGTSHTHGMTAAKQEREREREIKSFVVLRTVMLIYAHERYELPSSDDAHMRA